MKILLDLETISKNVEVGGSFYGFFKVAWPDLELPDHNLLQVVNLKDYIEFSGSPTLAKFLQFDQCYVLRLSRIDNNRYEMVKGSYWYKPDEYSIGLIL